MMNSFSSNCPSPSHVNLDDDLVLFAVASLAGVVAEAVLVTHHRVDALERGRQLARKGDREVFAARLSGESL